MKYNRVVTLGKSDAVDTIKEEEKVYYRRGVWNKYELTDTASAIDCIKNSGYGADIYFSDENEMYYVSIPNDSDMW